MKSVRLFFMGYEMLPKIMASLFFGALFSYSLPYATAINNIAFHLSVFVFVVVYKKNILSVVLSGKYRLFLYYCIWVIVWSIYYGYDVQADIKVIRNTLFEQFAVLIISSVLLGSGVKKIFFIRVLLSSFYLLTLGAFFSLIAYSFMSGTYLYDISINSEIKKSYRFIDDYALKASFFSPLIVYLLLLPNTVVKKYEKHVGAMFFLVSFVVVLLYGTVTVEVIYYLLFIYLAFATLKRNAETNNRNYSFVGVIAILVFTYGASSLVMNDKISGMYHDFLLNDFQVEESFMSGRGALWKLAVTCFDEAPILTGYGYGWKKLQKLCSSDAVIKKLEVDGNYNAANIARSKRFSFHNQYIENILVAGIVGSILWLSFVLFPIFYIIKISPVGGIRHLILLTILPYIIINMTNSMWQNSDESKLLLVLYALIFFAMDNTKSNRQLKY